MSFKTYKNQLLLKGLITFMVFIGVVFSGYGQIVVTPATGPGYTLCVNGAFAAIGDIVIDETADTDIYATDTLPGGGPGYYQIQLPAGFEFNTGAATSVSAVNPKDVSVVGSGYIDASNFEFWYTTTSGAKRDRITISGFEVKAVSANTGNILRVTSATGVDGWMEANDVGANINHGILRSADFNLQSFTSSDSDNSICEGQSVTFTAIPSIQDVGNQFQFYKNIGTLVQDAVGNNQYITTTLTNGDEITVVITYVNDGTCTASNNVAGSGITTSVSATPTASAAANPTTICSNETSDLSGSSVGGGASGGIWTTTGNGFFSPNSSTVAATYTPGSSDSGTITLTLTTTGGGCPSVQSTVDITVNRAPDITIQPVNAEACEGDPSSFSVTASGTSLTYQWQILSGTWGNIAEAAPYSGTQSSSLIISDVSGLDGNQYRCIVTESLTCDEISDVVTLTENALPIDRTVEEDDSYLCYGGFTKIWVRSSETSINYQLINITAGNVQVGSVKGGTTLDLDFDTDFLYETTNFKIIGTNVTTGCTKEFGPITINVNDEITAIAIASDIEICENESTELFVTATGGSGTFTYLWTGPTTLTNATTDNATYTPTSSGINKTFTITVTDSDVNYSDCQAVDQVV
ncbi:hypothetical protein ACFLU5_05710, partial [Bacteroidota bacterium]